MGEKNARGIPYVAFIDSVEGTLATTTDGTVEKLIGAMNELHQKFKILEGHKARTKASMKLKIPEIKRTLQLVRHIQEKHQASEDFGAHYSLSEMLYGRAKVTPDYPGSCLRFLHCHLRLHGFLPRQRKPARHQDGRGGQGEDQGGADARGRCHKGLCRSSRAPNRRQGIECLTRERPQFCRVLQFQSVARFFVSLLLISNNEKW